MGINLLNINTNMARSIRMKRDEDSAESRSVTGQPDKLAQKLLHPSPHFSTWSLSPADTELARVGV